MSLNILLGLALCFSGYLVSKIRIVLGGVLGYIVAANIGFSISQSQWMSILIGLAGAAVGALVSTVFYYLGLFLIGALLGDFLASSLYSAVTRLQPQPLVVFVSAMAGGVVVLLFRKVRVMVMIIATALAGAGLTVFGILSFATGNANGAASWNAFTSGSFSGYLLFAGWLVLALCGITVQYKLLPEKEKKDPIRRASSGENPEPLRTPPAY